MPNNLQRDPAFEERREPTLFERWIGMTSEQWDALGASVGGDDAQAEASLKVETSDGCE